jgi:iron complex transport system substrate-binding protein
MGLAAPTGPRRIVCLTEEPTEILYALGEEDRIVGISAYTVRPPDAKRDKPVVSAFTGGSVEKIAALKPDLVVGFSDIQAELARSLIAAGLPVLITNQRSLEEILEVVLGLGRLVGAADRAQGLIDGYRTRLDAMVSRTATRRRRPRVYFEEWDDPQICGIRWVSELIRIAGGDDVFADRARGALASQRFVTAADVVAARPDVILASWCGKPFDAHSLRARQGFDAVPAVAEGALHEIDAAIILQPGPACLTDGVDALAAILEDWTTRHGAS